MNCNVVPLAQLEQEAQGELIALRDGIVLLGPESTGDPGDQLEFDPAEDDLWLQQMAERSSLPWKQRLAQAIGFITEALEGGPGPVELIVTPSHWHPWVDYVIVRPLQEGRAPSLQILSLDETEQSVWNWLKRSPKAAPQRRGRRRVRAPIHLFFDRNEIVSPAGPTLRDIKRYVIHCVRKNYDAIERA